MYLNLATCTYLKYENSGVVRVPVPGYLEVHVVSERYVAPKSGTCERKKNVEVHVLNLVRTFRIIRYDSYEYYLVVYACTDLNLNRIKNVLRFDQSSFSVNLRLGHLKIPWYLSTNLEMTAPIEYQYSSTDPVPYRYHTSMSFSTST